MKKGNVLKSITKQITCIFSGVLNAYWRSLLCAVFCYTVFHFFDLFFIKSVIENDVYTLVYRIGFFVSFCIFSVARGVICENKETEKTAMALGGYKEYLSSYWLVETVLLVLVSFACILLYFIFDELSPFSLAYFYLSETAGFVLSFFALAVCRLLAVVVHFKKKRIKKSFVPWYKACAAFAVVVIALIVFSPSRGSTEPKNPFLFWFLICCAVLAFLIKGACNIIRFTRITNVLKLKKARDIKCNYFGSKKKCDLCYTIGGKRYNVIFLSKIEKLARHYFEDEYTIRRFVGVVTSSRAIARARISDQVTWHEISEINLPWGEIKENDNYIVVFKKYPTEISDHLSRDKALGNGDFALGKILIFNTIGFWENIQK